MKKEIKNLEWSVAWSPWWHGRTLIHEPAQPPAEIKGKRLVRKTTYTQEPWRETPLVQVHKGCFWPLPHSSRVRKFSWDYWKWFQRLSYDLEDWTDGQWRKVHKFITTKGPFPDCPWLEELLCSRPIKNDQRRSRRLSYKKKVNYRV